MTRHAIVLALALLAAGTTLANADTLTKEQCVDSHSRGQDARDTGKLSLARKLFLTCAQSGCPMAVQSDCARFADDLTNQQPTIVLVARDGNGNDLPNTTVYLDGALIVTRLDGRPIDVDPGNHTVKFETAGSVETVTVVIGAGEKGRTVQARFATTPAATPPVTTPSAVALVPAPRPARPRTTHPRGSLAIAVGGGVLALGGSFVAVWGASKIPANCSLSTHECAASPGDPAFDKAARGARTMNIGIVTGAIGVAALAGGLVWYYAGAKTSKESATQVGPIVTRDSAGFALSGSF
jgi:hypothetical protein